MNNIFDYAILSIFRYGSKNISITIIFGILVFLLSSCLFITQAIKGEYNAISKDLPDILVQSYYGEKSHFIDESYVDKFYEIPSVKAVSPRIWGQYYFQKEKVYSEIFNKDKNITLFDRFFLENDKAYFTIFGILPYQKNFIKELDNTDFSDKNENFMLISTSVREFVKIYENAFKFVPFFTPKNELIKLIPNGNFSSQSSLLNSDFIAMNEENARKILGIKNGFYSDIVLEISNKNEVNFIAEKIRLNYPDLRVLTKDEIIKKYKFLYDYKSGFFLMLLAILALTFIVILYDKASGLRSEEKREIGILRAIGWDISDIIKFKIYESLILSVLAFFIAITLAIFYVFILQAPILSDIFMGYTHLKPKFDLSFTLDFKILTMLFLLSVPLYISATIIPSFKAASSDEMEILR